jgi:hypothetical protein
VNVRSPFLLLHGSLWDGDKTTMLRRLLSLLLRLRLSTWSSRWTGKNFHLLLLGRRLILRLLLRLLLLLPLLLLLLLLLLLQLLLLLLLQLMLLLLEL